MTIQEAYDLVNAYDRNPNPTDEDAFLFTEAMRFLIEKQHDPRDMMYLGGWYYEQHNYDLALRYYEMASSYGCDDADVGLGYIWYYGRTGERDYEKAFHYYSRSMRRGNINSAYKVADMYRNGYYVKKDQARYVSMIEELYQRVRNARDLFSSVPEIYTRLARIRKEQGRMEEAVDLYLYAKDFLAQRIRYNPFWGNRNIMKWLIEDLYDIIPLDPANIDLYDLFYILHRPTRVTFWYDEEEQHVESVLEDGACIICCNGKWFRTIDDFIGNGRIGDQLLTAIYNDLYGFQLVEWAQPRPEDGSFHTDREE